jgi:hypothetical protein
MRLLECSISIKVIVKSEPLVAYCLPIIMSLAVGIFMTIKTKSTHGL